MNKNVIKMTYLNENDMKGRKIQKISVNCEQLVNGYVDLFE